MEEELAVPKVQDHMFGNTDQIRSRTKNTVPIDSKRIKHSGVVKPGYLILRPGVSYGAIYGLEEAEQRTVTV